MQVERRLKKSTTGKPNEDNIIAIDADGDLLLQIQSKPGEEILYYQISSNILRRASLYFNRLLDPEKFSEGAEFCTKLSNLMDVHSDVAQIPAVDLPVVHISDVGSFPARYPNKGVMTHFFDVLHGTNSFWVTTGSLPNHIALLALVADRFDATKPVLEHMVSQGWTQTVRDAKETKKTSSIVSSHNKEVFWRQRIYAGVLLGIQDWVMNFSRLLIDAGSKRWRLLVEEGSDIEDDAPWWNLPRGVEGKRALSK